MKMEKGKDKEEESRAEQSRPETGDPRPTVRDCERIFQFPIQTQAQQDDKLLAGQVVTREGEGSG